MENTRTRLYRQISVASAWALVLTGLLTLTGCAGKLEEPERFLAAGTTNSSTTPTCLTTLFNQKCNSAGCHSAVMPGGDLDLESPNVASRLINTPATFGGVVIGPAAMCSPAKLIDTATPSASWLEVKILKTQGSCGASMPLIGMLTDAEQNCITDYVMTAGM